MGTGIKYYLAILILLLSCGVSKHNNKSNTLYISEEDYIKAYKTVILLIRLAGFMQKKLYHLHMVTEIKKSQFSQNVFVML